MSSSPHDDSSSSPSNKKAKNGVKEESTSPPTETETETETEIEPIFGYTDPPNQIENTDTIWAMNKFTRHPSRFTDVAVPTPPSSFPGGTSPTGYLELIRRISDTCYAVKAVGCDGYGVEYSYLHKRRHAVPTIFWIPNHLNETNLNGHDNNNAGGGGGGGDITIIDTFHSDLIDPETGITRVTPSHVENWCKTNVVKHLFLNKWSEHGNPPGGFGPLRTAIEYCGTKLETIVLYEWVDIPASVFQTIGNCAGTSLKGLHLDTCDLANQKSHDAIVAMLKQCTNLVWLGLDIIGNFQFTAALLSALPASIKVLYIRGRGTERTEVGTNAISKISAQLPNLKIRLLFPDKKLNSA